MVLSFSNVACRLTRSDGAVLLPSGFNTPLNMMLYRSSLISGISISRKPEPPSERLGVAESTGAGLAFVVLTSGTDFSASSIASSISGSVLDLVKRVNLGAFFPATVLLLSGVVSPDWFSLELEAATYDVGKSTLIGSGAFTGSDCFPRPNNEPKNFRFCVFCLCTGGSGVLRGGRGENTSRGGVISRGCQPARGLGVYSVVGLPKAIPI